MISLREVSVIKNKTPILSDISLEIAEKRVGIIGRNGSGKSTLAKLFNGLEIPTSGLVTLVDSVNQVIPLNKNVGFVFQNPDNQIVFPIVEEDLAFGLKSSGKGKKEIVECIDYYLNKFDLNALKSRYTHQLSGGEKQLIALIGVLVMGPKYIVLDEPTTLLDLANRILLIRVLRNLEQNLIIVSHDLDFVSELDRVILIEDGEVIRDSIPSVVLPYYRETSIC
ncbi:MAG: ABC transporter ATP-binding protein [Flavobacteriaceae bacterium]|nr:ABC transporter ATP-binding protein [Flavobacteriaceae bacterium]